MSCLPRCLLKLLNWPAVGSLPYDARRQADRLRELDHPDVVEEEQVLRKARERRPPHRLDGVRTTREGIGRVVLDVRLREDADPAELARLAGAVARCDHERRCDERARAAKRRCSVDLHEDEHHRRMAVVVEFAVGNRPCGDRNHRGNRNQPGESR
jgi:hypothetical protein